MANVHRFFFFHEKTSSHTSHFTPLLCTLHQNLEQFNGDLNTVVISEPHHTFRYPTRSMSGRLIIIIRWSRDDALWIASQAPSRGWTTNADARWHCLTSQPSHPSIILKLGNQTKISKGTEWWTANRHKWWDQKVGPFPEWSFCLFQLRTVGCSD